MKEKDFFNKFEQLPLGRIRPSGWLKNQLIIQANGMTGQLEEHWPDLGPDSAWLGGEGEGWERGPYYLDGLVPLAYLLEDEKLVRKSQKWIEWILDSQKEDGWFGPENNDDWWSRMIVFKVLIQYFETTQDERVIPFMLRYANYQLRHLKKRPLSEWGKARGGEEIFSLIWLFKKTKKKFLFELIELIKEQSTDWVNLYENYPFTRYVTEFNHESHVVNVAMALKYFGLEFQMTGDDYQREILEKTLYQLTVYHGQMHGMVSGDEWLAGTHPSQGTELCSIVEYMFSMEILLKIFGETEFGDRWERAAFNALPAAISRDWLAHQYDQQVNQISCNHAKRNWTENNEDANIFGLEPHFGCCTANMHQGWPKFVSNLWMRDEVGLVCQSISPCIVNDGDVEIKVEGNYPFELSAKLTVSSTINQVLKIRIPIWVKKIVIQKNGKEYPQEISGSYLVISHENGICTYEISYAAEIIKEWRGQRAVGITYGPLIFALPIQENWQITAGEDPFYDWEVLPESDWCYALATDEDYKIENNLSLKKQVFDSLNSPIWIKTIGWKVTNWSIKDHSADTPPYTVKTDSQKELTLVPYGGAKLRIAEFPTVDRRP
ncbi:hypothetical protein RV11_GL000211 [Enterococcus phoeniculicola]|uniref:DUF1680 family protein n=1 Tax=Enterococcus phoeniculicola ATCC BAA-412 TaxID=1158610 RepID=R3WD13_9ENTE|nr:beta-L-arabinofuranosidase domain-containing protein [Enterococcus phoeniculicola]EOL45357.1 hypothetical protein UC3_01247 [Enterococcus phoeniculicola ATCC BAA-412]EOT74719.1 hypothetical protein I589_02319 [Enterococcus phoeniculicola ATCC BAA-412]OJG73845.1 hypothetical protein RV11_GL000211 [Enterococcus phoeniculicola]